ncbi:MAG: hypothetical protein H6850_04460 [Alphaproteobacteria bacterium]|nr:MAG: hypothetical protein H6850_04460 [Alphaproteobacteria bacterium]
MVDINNLESALEEIKISLGGDFSQANLETVLKDAFDGVDISNEENIALIKAITGALFTELQTTENLTDLIIFAVMLTLLLHLDPNPSAETVSLFFAYFCKFFRPTCACFENFTLSLLKDLGFDIKLTSDEGAKNFGTAIGLHAKIVGLELTECLKPYTTKVKGNMLAHAFKALFDLKQEDFLTMCESYLELDLRIKFVGEELKKLIDAKIIKNNEKVIADVMCNIIKTWETLGFNFCTKSLVDFLIMHTKVSREKYEEIKACAYVCLDIPAVKNAYLKIDECAEIDLSQFVLNDNTAFTYTLDSSDTKGQIALSKLHPPCAPLVRYQVPSIQKSCEKFKDVFSFTVKNLSNDTECTAFVFLLHVQEQKCFIGCETQCQLEC